MFQSVRLSIAVAIIGIAAIGRRGAAAAARRAKARGGLAHPLGAAR